MFHFFDAVAAQAARALANGGEIPLRGFQVNPPEDLTDKGAQGPPAGQLETHLSPLVTDDVTRIIVPVTVPVIPDTAYTKPNRGFSCKTTRWPRSGGVA